MTPILYEKGETAFTSNGLGRLRDCITCIVTEQRNGVYECAFEYPTDGLNYDKITPGRIIAVTHEDSEDVQPFDIVSYERTLEGVVKFHAVHISYRLNGATVTASNINSLSEAFAAFGSPLGFSFSSDKAHTGYIGAFDGTPRTIRQTLGGVEGSILDAYGGEYEFNGFSVIHHDNRGVKRDFSVRYGLNLLEFEENQDYSDTYSSVIPYWKGTEEIVVGVKVSSGSDMYNGVEKCVPLDLTDKFETKPTKAQLKAMAESMLASNSPVLPDHTLKVDFLRLSDLEEYADFAQILTCKLCDQIRVVVPEFSVDAYFKIVQTEYDVLLDRYESAELGVLQTSLAEALGVDTTVSPAPAEYVIERHSLWTAGDVTVAAGAYKEGTVTVTKSGYKPRGVVGHAFTGTNRTYMNAGPKLRLINIDSGSCDVDYLIRNTLTSNSWAGVLNVDILWIKEV